MATSARRRVANRIYNSARLQKNIRAQAAKFVQNADAQEQAKKRRATQNDNNQQVPKRTQHRKI